MRDSLYILDGILEIDSRHRPDMIATDTASYTDQVFGLFALLGYRFSPRLADLPDQRFWAINPPDTYGPLSTAARGRINLDLITDNWDDMLRAAGALITGHTRASDLLRVTQSGGTPSILGRAIAEYGRIAKTLHLLDFIDQDDGYHAKFTTSSPCKNPAMRSHDESFTATAAKSWSPTAPAKKNNSAPRFGGVVGYRCSGRTRTVALDRRVWSRSRTRLGTIHRVVRSGCWSGRSRRRCSLPAACLVWVTLEVPDQSHPYGRTRHRYQAQHPVGRRCGAHAVGFRSHARPGRPAKVHQEVSRPQKTPCEQPVWLRPARALASFARAADRRVA